MLIASKFEEIFPPGVDDFVYISDNTFTRVQVIEMETLMLNSLEFDLTNPTALGFLTRYTRICNSDAVVTTLAKYLAELTLMVRTCREESNFLTFITQARLVSF